MSETKEVVVRALSALSNSPVYDLRRLKVAGEGGRLRLSGHVGSYYHKQIAQETLRPILGEGMMLENAVTVADRARA